MVEWQITPYWSSPKVYWFRLHREDQEFPRFSVVVTRASGRYKVCEELETRESYSDPEGVPLELLPAILKGLSLCKQGETIESPFQEGSVKDWVEEQNPFPGLVDRVFRELERGVPLGSYYVYLDVVPACRRLITPQDEEWSVERYVEIANLLRGDLCGAEYAFRTEQVAAEFVESEITDAITEGLRRFQRGLR
jgi:hypothetical protein